MTSQPRHHIVAEMLNAGSSRQEIADAVGITRTQVTAAVYAARCAGLIPPFTRKKPDDAEMRAAEYRMKTRNVRRGRMTEFFKTLSPEAGRWIIDQVPEGGCLAEVIASIVTDAYYEENPDA